MDPVSVLPRVPGIVGGASLVHGNATSLPGASPDSRNNWRLTDRVAQLQPVQHPLSLTIARIAIPSHYANTLLYMGLADRQTRTASVKHAVQIAPATGRRHFGAGGREGNMKHAVKIAPPADRRSVIISPFLLILSGFE
jgi:hypothetical protein